MGVRRCTVSLAAAIGCLGCSSAPPAAMPAPSFQPATHISFVDQKWRINGQVTYEGARAEGLLMNVRMVNTVFEDRKKPAFDPERNTDAFIAKIPEYVACGMRAFTVGLQGGMPGYEGAVNSAFENDGALRPSYLRRVARVIEACDRAGAAVILGCFYQRQDQILDDAEAVRRGVANVVRWIEERGYTNVLLEIANEFGHSGYDHEVLKTAEGEAELVRLAKREMPGLLVATSGLGDGELESQVAIASDFLLIHFNVLPVEKIRERVETLRHYRKPIVCNEDDKVGAEGARAAEAAVGAGISWGFMAKHVNQYFPLRFMGAADDPDVYAKIKELVSR